MSFLKRLFSTPLRRAREAELAGDLNAAAALYARAEARDDLVRVHLLRADRALDPWSSIQALRDTMAAADPERTEVWGDCARRLARALSEWVRSSSLVDRRDRGLLREAGELWEKVGDHELAGDAFSEGGLQERAAAAYTAAGAVEKLDEVYARRETTEPGRSVVQQHVRDFHAACDAADFLHAHRAIEAALACAAAGADVRALYDRFAATLPTPGHLALATEADAVVVLLGLDRLQLGRDEAADVSLALPGVSRQHALLERVGDALTLVDAGSRHGTRLDGASCQAPVALAECGTVELGERCVLDYQRHGHTVVLTPRAAAAQSIRFVCGRDLELHALGVCPRPLRFVLSEGYWLLTPREGVLVGSQALSQPRLLRRGDEIVALPEPRLTLRCR